jgi:hypothetical protein
MEDQLMFPWFFLWAPHYYFPWSGAVKQDIAPNTDWFFDAIAPAAGDGRIEKAIFEEASYGKQLGVLSDVVLSLVAEKGITPAEAEHAVGQLIIINHNIKNIKEKYKCRRIDTAVRILEQLQESDPEELERIVTRFQRLSEKLSSAPGGGDSQ